MNTADFSMMILIVCLALVGLVFPCLVVIKEFERGVIFTLGRFSGVRGAGLQLVIPFLQQMRLIDIRALTMQIPRQDLITRDNVSVSVDAVVYFKVMNPADAIIRVYDYVEAISQLAQTTLRAVLGEHELDELLSDRDKLSHAIQEILVHQATVWGIEVAHVAIKDIDLNEAMIRALAKQAEAERERRSKLILAEAETQIAQLLCDAARLLSDQPMAMQVRYLQTAAEIAGKNNSSTFFFPLPAQWSSIVESLTNVNNKVKNS